MKYLLLLGLIATALQGGDPQGRSLMAAGSSAIAEDAAKQKAIAWVEAAQVCTNPAEVARIVFAPDFEVPPFADWEIVEFEADKRSGRILSILRNEGGNEGDGTCREVESFHFEVTPEGCQLVHEGGRVKFELLYVAPANGRPQLTEFDCTVEEGGETWRYASGRGAGKSGNDRRSRAPDGTLWKLGGWNSEHEEPNRVYLSHDQGMTWTAAPGAPGQPHFVAPIR